MDELIQRILNKYEFVTDEIKKRLTSGFPAKDKKNFYKVHEMGKNSENVKLYSQISVPELGSHILEWGIRIDMGFQENTIPEIPNIESISDSKLLKEMINLKSKNIPGLTSIKLYLQLINAKKTGEGLWFVTFDSETEAMDVSYILKHEFIKDMEPNGYPSLIGKPLIEALQLYLDFIFDMYKKE